MNKNKLTGVEKSIHAAVETFQKNLCREMAKRLDEGKLILDMETEVSFTTANVDEFIEEQIQELYGTLKPMEETLGADTAQKTEDEFARTYAPAAAGGPYPQRKDAGCTAQGRAGTRHSRWADDRRRREGAAVPGAAGR